MHRIWIGLALEYTSSNKKSDHVNCDQNKSLGHWHKGCILVLMDRNVAVPIFRIFFFFSRKDVGRNTPSLINAEGTIQITRSPRLYQRGPFLFVRRARCCPPLPCHSFWNMSGVNAKASMRGEEGDTVFHSSGWDSTVLFARTVHGRNGIVKSSAFPTFFSDLHFLAWLVFFPRWIAGQYISFSCNILFPSSHVDPAQMFMPTGPFHLKLLFLNSWSGHDWKRRQALAFFLLKSRSVQVMWHNHLCKGHEDRSDCPVLHS